MAFVCDKCGFRTNEIKGGGAVPKMGERITLKVNPNEKDVMNRDVLKADSAYVAIPEIELEMAAGSLGGIYTTIEGLLSKIKSNIEDGNPFAVGDSDGGRSKLTEWLSRVEALRCGTEAFTLILSDPLGNSFIYSPYGKASDDPMMTSELYERTFEENEDLGLNDMNTEEYSSEPIYSDKNTMAGGGEAIRPEAYHPNPKAVQETNIIITEDTA